MSLPRWLALLLLVLTATTLPAQKRRAAGGSGWTSPSCSQITGLISVRFLKPDGSVAKSVDPSVNDHAWDIKPGALPNTLYATHDGTLYVSRNGGCSWQLQAVIPQFEDTPASLITTHLAPIYVYSQESLARVEGAVVDVSPFPERMVRVAASRADAAHLRAVSLHGKAYESRDAGRTWTALGTITQQGIYAAAFDPLNFDRILAATTGHGWLMASRDGGRTWTRTSLPPTNVWTIEFSPRDSRVVWVQGWEQGKHDVLFRSRDGGQTFDRALTFGEAGLTFSRAVLAPHPTDAELVAVETHQGLMLYRGTTTLKSGDRPRAMTWSPSGTLYFVAPDQVIFH